VRKQCQGQPSQSAVKIVSARIKTGMRRLRISAISYLNTAPLMWDFEHGRAGVEAGREFDISYTLPSACARALESGTADIGIIPAAAYAQVPGLMVLPGVAIASRRPVRSILLVSRVPVDQIRTVALDTSSMTSVALTKILFEKWLGGGRTFTSMAPDVEKMLAQHDAGLVIGDPALQIDRSRYVTLDLAEEWIRHTGKPFVFAFWAVRQQALQEDALCGKDTPCGDSRPRLSASRSDAPVPQDMARVFQQSRDHGLEPRNLELIVREWAARLHLKESDVRSYLTENIYYYLDEPCIEGLQLFYRYAAEIGALPAAPEMRYLVSADAAVSRTPVPAA
jgi:chorismate dehydratase